jgi:quinol monooxygenase YgiN
MIFIVVKHPVRPEYADGWASIMAEFTAATRAEPGNISFDWYRSADDPNLYLLVEAFRDGAAGEAHVSTEHFKAAIARMPSLLAAAPEIVHVEVPGDGWSRMSEIQLED